MAGLVGTLLMFLSGRPVVAKGGGRGGSSHPSSGGKSGTRGTGSNPKSHSTKGYTRKDGTHVRPHHQTSPNNTTRDNYNTRGNYNPHNGKVGTRSSKD